MHKVYLGVGSNQGRVKNIRSGLIALKQKLSDIKLSPVYESEAQGFSGPAFYNFVVEGKTRLSLEALSYWLKAIEHDHGRLANAEKYSDRFLDVDILLFDDLVGCFSGIKLPRTDVLEQSFVLIPLSDIAPDLIHPKNHLSFMQLRRERPAFETLVNRVDFKF